MIYYIVWNIFCTILCLFLFRENKRLRELYITMSGKYEHLNTEFELLAMKHMKRNSNLDEQLVKESDMYNAILAERDQARQIAEKFREKYLVLKQKEDAVRLRAQLEMNNYKKNTELNSGWK